jgi:hypothetical protein
VNERRNLSLLFEHENLIGALGRLAQKKRIAVTMCALMTAPIPRLKSSRRFTQPSWEHSKNTNFTRATPKRRVGYSSH